MLPVMASVLIRLFRVKLVPDHSLRAKFGLKFMRIGIIIMGA